MKRTATLICAVSLPGILLALCTLARAEEKLTLADAQAAARGLNPELRRLDAQVAADDVKTWEPLGGYLPRFDVSTQALRWAQYEVMGVVFGGQTISFPGAFPQITFDERLSWTFDGLRGWNEWRADSAELRAARLERDHAAFRLRQEIAIRFYKALAADQLAEAAEQNVATLDDHLRLVKASEDSGDSTHFDVLRIRAQREEAGASAQQAHGQAGLAREDLAQAMGLSEDARSLSGALPVPEESAVPESLQADLGAREDLLALRERRAALAARRAELLSAWMPAVTFFWDKQYYHFDGAFSPEILDSGANVYGSLEMEGLAATWNLFGGGSDAARVREMSHELDAADAGLTAADLAARRDFDSWKNRYRDSVRLYRARLKVLDECKESVRLAKLGLEAGELTNTEVLDSELDLFRARAGLLQAQSDAAEALLNIRLLSGRKD
jgi:outer membrane protein TolC